MKLQRVELYETAQFNGFPEANFKSGQTSGRNGNYDIAADFSKQIVIIMAKKHTIFVPFSNVKFMEPIKGVQKRKPKPELKIEEKLEVEVEEKIDEKIEEKVELKNLAAPPQP